MSYISSANHVANPPAINPGITISGANAAIILIIMLLAPTTASSSNTVVATVPNL